MVNKNLPNQRAVERVRKMYPKGTRVELVHMDDPYSQLKPGNKGTVRLVDDTGTVSWTGTAVPGLASCTVLTR